MYLKTKSRVRVQRSKLVAEKNDRLHRKRKVSSQILLEIYFPRVSQQQNGMRELKLTRWRSFGAAEMDVKEMSERAREQNRCRNRWRVATQQELSVSSWCFNDDVYIRTQLRGDDVV